MFGISAEESPASPSWPCSPSISWCKPMACPMPKPGASDSGFGDSALMSLMSLIPSPRRLADTDRLPVLWAAKHLPLLPCQFLSLRLQLRSHWRHQTPHRTLESRDAHCTPSTIPSAILGQPDRWPDGWSALPVAWQTSHQHRPLSTACKLSNLPWVAGLDGLFQHCVASGIAAVGLPSLAPYFWHGLI